jgi:SAM-dependent methyltransferase
MTQTTKGHLVRIADWGVTEEAVIFGDDFVLARIPQGGDVLDIGCGRGVFDAKVAARARSVTGIDIMPEEIDAARAGGRGANVSFLVHDAEQLAQLPGLFDAVVSRFCFHHLDMDRVAAGIAAKLKPGGRLIAIDCFEDYWKLGGSLFILRDATRRLGLRRMIALMPRLLFFFTPKRFAHVASDIRRLKEQKRYLDEDFRAFYEQRFPGAEIGRIGCAAYIDWRRP